MTLNNAFNWRCPACNESLMIKHKQWTCSNLHCFDIAKEGYVNLLLAQHKKSKDPGDNKDMVSARRSFLAQDYYLPLANHIAKLLHQHFASVKPKTSPISLLDAGCGEGYYLEKIARYIYDEYPEDCKPDIHACGIDISKSAIQKAAKKYKSNERTNFYFAVASCFDLPILDKSQKAIIQIFAPAKDDEILRTLHNDGVWIKVSPATDHLFELKSMVYDKPAKHEVDTSVPPKFSLISQHDVRFNISLKQLLDRQNLLMMTPFYWTISEAKKQLLLANLQATQAHFDIRIFKRSNSKAL